MQPSKKTVYLDIFVELIRPYIPDKDINGHKKFEVGSEDAEKHDVPY